MNPRNVAFAYRLFRAHPARVKLPLPVSVFCYRVTDSIIGFQSKTDRDIAQAEMKTFADAHQLNLLFTPICQVHAPIAAQVVILPNDGRQGAQTVRHGGVLRRHKRGSLRSVLTGQPL